MLASLAGDKQEKLEKDKLMSNYTSALNSFQEVQKYVFIFDEAGERKFYLL